MKKQTLHVLGIVAVVGALVGTSLAFSAKPAFSSDFVGNQGNYQGRNGGNNGGDQGNQGDDHDHDHNHNSPTPTPTVTPTPTPKYDPCDDHNGHGDNFNVESFSRGDKGGKDHDGCPTPTPTATPSATPTPVTPTQPPSNPGGPGDGRSDGRSDGGSSCPSCTAAPSGQVLGAETGFANTGVADEILMNAVGVMGAVSTVAGSAIAIAKKRMSK